MQGDMKVLVSILTHDRRDENRALRLCIEHTKNCHLAERLGVKFEFHYFHSGGRDYDEVKHTEYFSRVENYPDRGRRHNECLAIAMEREWDYFMQLGSDDVITPAG